MKQTTKTILEELILLFSSILIFRSGWTLLDHVPWLHEDVALWIMLIAGSTVIVVVLYLLNTQRKKDTTEPAS